MNSCCYPPACQAREQQKRKEDYNKEATKLMLEEDQASRVSRYVLAAYLLNPYIIFNCVGMATTAFANLVLSIALLGVAVKSRMMATFFVAIATHQGFYPMMLLVPVVLATMGHLGGVKQVAKSALFTTIIFGSSLGVFLWLSCLLAGNWRFLESTYGCM